MATTWAFNGHRVIRAPTGIIVQTIIDITLSNIVAIPISRIGCIAKIVSIIIILALVIFVIMMSPGIFEVIDMVIAFIIDITQIVGTEKVLR